MIKIFKVWRHMIFTQPLTNCHTCLETFQRSVAYFMDGSKL